MEIDTLTAVLAVSAIVLALGFDFVNGFHDTANAVATVIYSGAMRARNAILMSAALNFIGAVTIGTTVALFVTGIIPFELAKQLELIIAVLLAGVAWNLVTWHLGLPVSSSHCLLGSLIGAGIAAGGLGGVNMAALYKALIALVLSPVAGFLVALLVAYILRRVAGNDPEKRSQGLRRALPGLQILSSAAVSYSHGANDGQKTMGIITLILATQFHRLGYSVDHVPFWVVLSAAAALGLGTAIGGWRVIKTVGEKLSLRPIDPVHGCAAEFTTAATVFTASAFGVPVSTTHTLTSSVVGGTYGLYGPGHTDISTMKKIVYAWLLTLPVTAIVSGLLYFLLRGHIGVVPM